MKENNFIYKGYCELAIISDVVSPDVITEELNIFPERSFRKGAKSVSRYSGSTITRPHNLWALQSMPIETYEETIKPHLDYLKSMFQLKLEVLKKYKNDSRFEVSFWIWIQTDNSGIGFDLDEEHLDFLNAITNRIHFSLLTQ